jgi:GntR family transcriptional regulator
MYVKYNYDKTCIDMYNSIDYIFVMINKQAAEPLYVQIQTMLEEQILSGQIKPGEKTPSEHELASRYNVSRLTARHALDQLVTRNLLFRQPGKGTFVADHGMANGFSTMISFSRSMVEDGFKVETKILDQAIIPGSPPVTEELRLEPNCETIIIRRLRIVDGHPAAIHTSYFSARIYAPILKMDLTQNSLLEIAEKVGSIRMAYSQDSLKAIPINVGDSELLKVSPYSPALLLEGVVFDENNIPARYTRAVYRGDMFQLDIRNTRTQPNSLRIIRVQ